MSHGLKNAVIVILVPSRNNLSRDLDAKALDFIRIIYTGHYMALSSRPKQ